MAKQKQFITVSLFNVYGLFSKARTKCKDCQKQIEVGDKIYIAKYRQPNGIVNAMRITCDNHDTIPIDIDIPIENEQTELKETVEQK